MSEFGYGFFAGIGFSVGISALVGLVLFYAFDGDETVEERTWRNWQ